MYCRNVSFKLKAKCAAEFTRILEEQIIPSLLRQKGFEDEISFVAPERNEAITVSLWNEIDDAGNYHRQAFPEVLNILSTVIDGIPKVETFPVENFTSDRIASSAVN